jgi:hypothetical protein
VLRPTSGKAANSHCPLRGFDCSGEFSWPPQTGGRGGPPLHRKGRDSLGRGHAGGRGVSAPTDGWAVLCGCWGRVPPRMPATLPTPGVCVFWDRQMACNSAKPRSRGLSGAAGFRPVVYGRFTALLSLSLSPLKRASPAMPPPLHHVLLKSLTIHTPTTSPFRSPGTARRRCILTLNVRAECTPGPKKKRTRHFQTKKELRNCQNAAKSSHERHLRERVQCDIWRGQVRFSQNAIFPLCWYRRARQCRVASRL